MPFTSESARIAGRRGGYRRAALLTWRQREAQASRAGSATTRETQRAAGRNSVAGKDPAALAIHLRSIAVAGGKAAAAKRAEIRRTRP